MQSPHIHRSLIICIYTVSIFQKDILKLFYFFSFFLHNHRIIIIGSISGPPVFYKCFTSVTIKLFFKSKWFFRMTVSKGNDSKSSIVTYFIHRSLYIYVNPNLPIHPTLLLFPLDIYKFVLNVCVSISVLQMTSSSPFF